MIYRPVNLVYTLLHWSIILIQLAASADNHFSVILDRSAAANRYIVFSSVHETTSATPEITGDLLARIAARAWKDMDANFKDEVNAWNAAVESNPALGPKLPAITGGNKGKLRPTVLTALFANNKIYISTAVKQGDAGPAAVKRPFLINMPADAAADESLVLQALRRCQMYAGTTADRTIGHIHSANCGEMTLLRGWELSTVNPQLDQLAAKLMVSVRRGGGAMKAIAPCGDDTEQKGCKFVLGELRIVDAVAGDVQIEGFEDVFEELKLGPAQQVRIFEPCARKRKRGGVEGGVEMAVAVEVARPRKRKRVQVRAVGMGMGMEQVSRAVAVY
ncbi:hypothetical protein BDV95DRAFT_71745 [Massariosphaeria phaeospora]|uniref:HMG box domain-containing protein n=1 Tax=Massariosphaeria phaeospora TaxID=100035 RepID=A0A7C8M854_9PLEO|nr:hypothetical protein BDV95DRAFT_71745 [Massariosphaeria phaeospora]